MTTSRDWVRTADHLPPETGHYLVYLDDGYVETLSFDATERGWWLFGQLVRSRVRVSHWMPLPSPPGPAAAPAIPAGARGGTDELIAEARRLGEPSSGDGWRRLLWQLADALEAEHARAERLADEAHAARYRDRQRGGSMP